MSFQWFGVQDRVPVNLPAVSDMKLAALASVGSQECGDGIALLLTILLEFPCCFLRSLDCRICLLIAAAAFEMAVLLFLGLKRHTHRPEYPAHLSLVLRCDLAFGQFQQLLHSEVGAQSFDFFVGDFDVEFFFQVH